MRRTTPHDAAPVGCRAPLGPTEASTYPLPLSREPVAITSTSSREATIPRSSTFSCEATGMRSASRHPSQHPAFPDRLSDSDPTWLWIRTPGGACPCGCVPAIYGNLDAQSPGPAARSRTRPRPCLPAFTQLKTPRRLLCWRHPDFTWTRSTRKQGRSLYPDQVQAEQPAARKLIPACTTRSRAVTASRSPWCLSAPSASCSPGTS